MLPMVVTLAHDQPLLRPDNLSSDRKADLEQALGDNGRAQRSVPDICDFAWKQAPRRRPIRDLVILNFVLPGLAVDAPPVAPCRVVLNTIGGIRDHQLRHRPRKHRSDHGRVRTITATHAMRPQKPDIGWPRDCRFTKFGDLVLVDLAGLRTAERRRQFLLVEA